jgi:hypothetical protein
VIVNGHITAGTAERFTRLLEATPGVEQVMLTSPGGRTLEAERMAVAIRERGLDTKVVDHCMSACTDILLAGRERYADQDTRIGFHQPSFPGVSARELSAATAEWRERYIAAGVEPGFAWRAMATPSEGMWFPTFEEMIAANVLSGTEPIVVQGKRAAA